MRQRLFFLLHHDRFDRELENLEAGMPLEEARYAAVRRFGNRTSLQERSREVWLFRFLETLAQDLRYAFRMLRHNPGFTAAVVLSLALGIGANTAIFSLIDAVMLRLLPVRAPEELVLFSSTQSRGTGASFGYGFSYFMLQRFREQARSVSGLAAFAPVRLASSIDGSMEPATEGLLVSGNYFSVLGVRPLIGRTFSEDDDRVPGAHPVAVLSYGYWKRRFAGDPATVGRTVQWRCGKNDCGLWIADQGSLRRDFRR